MIRGSQMFALVCMSHSGVYTAKYDKSCLSGMPAELNMGVSLGSFSAGFQLNARVRTKA